MSHKTPFPNPLTEDVLGAFCHPIPTHALARPVRIGAEIIAGNGYVCLRAHRGRWFDEEFPEATAEQQARIEALFWGKFDTLDPQCWEALDDVRGELYRHSPIAIWAIDKHGPTGKPSPTPIWKSGTCAPVRLSLLQLIARLPRCEVFTGSQDPSHPLFFRCTGARGIIAADPRLTTTSWKIFQPRFDQMDNCLVHQRKKDPTPWIQKTLKPGDRQTWSPTLPGNTPWPPPEPID
jgi:hypothetical protein